jgi:hypothetical protein
MHRRVSQAVRGERVFTQSLPAAPLTTTRTEDTDDDLSPVG